MIDELKSGNDLFSGWTLTKEMSEKRSDTVWRAGIELDDGAWTGSWYFSTDTAGKEYMQLHFDISDESWKETITQADKTVWRASIDETSEAVVIEIPVFDSADKIH